MKERIFILLIVIGFALLSGCASIFGNDKKTGKVTNINGTEVTIAFGEIKEGNQPKDIPPDKPEEKKEAESENKDSTENSEKTSNVDIDSDKTPPAKQEDKSAQPPSNLTVRRK